MFGLSRTARNDAISSMRTDVKLGPPCLFGDGLVVRDTTSLGVRPRGRHAGDECARLRFDVTISRSVTESFDIDGQRVDFTPPVAPGGEGSAQ